MRYQDKSIFPIPTDTDDDGIVAFSTAINCEMLIDAYSHGIFPWPFGEGEDYIPWCSPVERGVLMIEDFHSPHGTRRDMKKWNFNFAVDLFEIAVNGKILPPNGRKPGKRMI